MVLLVKLVVLAFSTCIFLKMFLLLLKTEKPLFQMAKKIPLAATGFIANVLDTFGLGSFAVIVALNKNWKMIEDKKLPGTLNGQSVIPSMIQSLLFLQFVEIDLLMLALFVVGACAGGFLCTYFVSRLNTSTIRMIMGFGFLIVGLLILGNLLHLLPIGGEEISLSTSKLAIGFFAMFLVGMFPAIGVGVYVPTQVALFLLGLSPLVAFPIMTTTGAIVQSSTAYAFTLRNEIALKESIWMNFAGAVGVAVAVPLITYVNHSTLRWILVLIVFYNALSIWQSFREKKAELAVE